MANNKQKNAPIVHSLLTYLLVIIIAVFIIGMCYFANTIFTMRQEIDSLRTSLSLETNTQQIDNSNANYYENYIELTEKAEAEMDRLVSVVGILATVYTIFGALIVFKAPHEIDKRVSKLNELITEANESAEEARYQAEIIDAVANAYNGEMTDFDKLRRISKVIDKYPKKPDAYMQRGFIYDDMRKFDKAISDYKIGLKNGIDKSTYYNDMGISLNKKGEYKKALSFYSKAIHIDPEDSIAYANRGSCYDDMHQYDKALSDYCKAIDLDDNCKEAYINRSISYKKQLERESNAEKKDSLYELMMIDLQKALEIDPDDNTTKYLLKSNIRSQFNPEETIAQIDEKIGDLEIENKNAFSAFKQYIESCFYYLKQTIHGHQQYFIDIERIVNKLFEINEEEIIPKLPKIADKLSDVCQYLSPIAVLFYELGKKIIAEKCFLLLSKYDTKSKNYALNLAFMKRRSETQYTTQTVSDLLNLYDNKADAIWCINKSLCYVSGSDNHEINWTKAVEVINDSKENFEAAIDWWSNISVVGEREHNMVMLLFAISSTFTVPDSTSLADRIKKAIDDGYTVSYEI